MTPDEWLLAQYDNGTAKPRNHVRQIIQLIDDEPLGSTELHPRWSGQAAWPIPAVYADLDRYEAVHCQRRTA